ncbi:MAG TPA: tetratricopeptide repeat protein [Minicystis sp.]|nr:tetratricopeptide repeat protein [Minicystis sp.]
MSNEEGEWVLIGLDEKMARRQGMPARLPVPKAEFEGLADKGLNMEVARKWIKDFLDNSEPGKSGHWRKANSRIVSALEAFLDKAPVWDKAQKAFAEKDYENAIKFLKRISTMDAEDHAAKLNLASAYANMGDHAQALKAFKQIRQTFEGDPDYHVALGHVHLALQDKDSALNEMVLALEAKPDFQPALDAMVQLGVLTPIYENPRDGASLLYVRADAVVEYLLQSWDAAPRDAAFFLEQLAYHEREQRPAVALAAAERAVQAIAHEPGAGADRAERAELARVTALRALGRNEEALAAVRAYLEKVPTSSGAHVELAKCLAAAGQTEQANQAIDKALEHDPGDLAALSFKFWPADPTDLKKVADATPALAAFAEAHPKSPGVWRSLARAYLVTGRTDDALALFAKAVELTPDDDDLRAEWWSELGKQQRYAEILADAGKMKELAKRDWKLRWNEAEAYLGSEKRIEARACFTALNMDDALHVDIRKRAKRAVKAIDEGMPMGV